MTKTKKSETRVCHTRISCGGTPNPTTNNFKIRSNRNAIKGNNYKIKVMDALGRKFYYKEINNFPQEGLNVDLKNASKGIYFVHILQNDERSTMKLILD